MMETAAAGRKEYSQADKSRPGDWDGCIVSVCPGPAVRTIHAVRVCGTIAKIRLSEKSLFSRWFRSTFVQTFPSNDKQLTITFVFRDVT